MLMNREDENMKWGGHERRKKKQTRTVEIVRMMLKTACDRELTSFIAVALTVLALLPSSIRRKSSS